ncbi:SDR family NAD(P)-dependent oxidoreductase [Micromonospora sp. NPDC050397]|uniref:SDR family NAD(P)-dependent oxidoreductase n=1 Tax=Micromonospora sp. NPDC050397 TaxID=3364279 RepID=UPI00384DAD2E
MEDRQRALVTGGSRGVGAAVAAALARAGYRVAVHCRGDLTSAHAVRDTLPGDGHTVVSGDLADPDAAESVVTASVAALGGLDLLVNNAGRYVELPVTADSYADWQANWREMLDVNLHGAANVTWCVVHHLLGRPEGPAGGRIVNVGSRGVFRGEPNAPAYGASKAGLHSLTQSLAVDLARHGIAVAAVAPGFVNTDMVAPLLDGTTGDAIRAQSPFRRIAEPAEIAAAVAWLASPEAVWASGAILDLNGASYLR